MRIALFLLTAVLSGSCGPRWQPQKPEHKEESPPQSIQIFYPETKGRFPAILLMPPAAHSISAETSIARKFAAEGYVAGIVDYGNVKFSGIFNDAAKMNSMKQLASQSLASLKAQPRVDPDRVGIIGYSFGGFFVTYLASKPDETGLRAGVIYYGTYDVPEAIKNLRIPILAFQGEADQMKEFVHNALAMKQVAMDHQKIFELVLYPRALHGFDRFPSDPYKQAIARNSWDNTITFLNRCLKKAGA